MRNKSRLELSLLNLLKRLLSPFLEENSQAKVLDKTILNAINQFLSIQSDSEKEEDTKKQLKNSINNLFNMETSSREYLKNAINKIIKSQNTRYLKAMRELMDLNRKVSLIQTEISNLRNQKRLDSYKKFL